MGDERRKDATKKKVAVQRQNIIEVPFTGAFVSQELLLVDSRC